MDEDAPAGVGGLYPVDLEGDPPQGWSWLAHLAGRRSPDAPTMEDEVTVGAALAPSLRAGGFVGVRVDRQAVDLRYTDAANWLRWSWSHGFRAVLERLTPDGLDRLAEGAGRRVEAAREADGFCHRRLTALFGYGRRDARPTNSCAGTAAVRRGRYGDDRPAARPVVA